MGGCGSKSGDRGDVVSHLDDTSTSQNKQDNFKIGDSDGGEAKPIDVMSVCDLTKVDLAADASQSGENFITCESPTPKMTPDAAVACYVSSTGQSMTSDTTLDDSVPVKPDISCEVHRYSERLILPTASADLESIKGAAQTMRSDNNASAFFDATGFRTSPVATSKQEELYPRAGIRSILHLERTNKFAAYCLRKPGHHAHIATPNVRQKSFSIGGNGFATEISSKFNGPFTPAMRHRSLNQQLSQKMIGDLRNTLNRLHTLKSSPGKRAQLIRLDSSGMNHLCCICKKTNTRGLMCEKDHFTCLDCFGPHVEKVCKNTKVLRKDNFGIHCPLRICDSACWNSYHVRKVLDGPSLELYIDTLVTMCREEELRHTPASTAAVHVGSEPYQSETLQVLRNQIKELNMVPLEYIPLEDINFELQEIFDRLNNGMDYDEARMEFLLMCMKQNPDFIAEEEEKNRKCKSPSSITV